MTWIPRTVAVLAVVLTTSLAANAQVVELCAGEQLAEREVGLTYNGHCIAYDLDGPPVQDVIVSETTDAWGAETALGILLVLGPDGRPAIAQPPYLVTNTEEVTLGEPYLFPEEDD